jgi:hypothetical protein
MSAQASTAWLFGLRSLFSKIAKMIQTKQADVVTRDILIAYSLCWARIAMVGARATCFSKQQHFRYLIRAHLKPLRFIATLIIADFPTWRDFMMTTSIFATWYFSQTPSIGIFSQIPV